MTWTPSPADEVPNPAGIYSLRKLFGFNLSKNVNSSSKGEERRPEPQHRQEGAQDKRDDPEQGPNDVELDDLELSAEAPGACP